MTLYEHQTFGQERALYGSRDALVRDCAFDGPEDGESALKESRDVSVERCYCNLRYPFWHNERLTIAGSELTGLCRAALWYCRDVTITETKLHGIKALRECDGVTVRNCDVDSPEFGWSVRGMTMEDCSARSEYFLLRSEALRFRNVRLRGKYAFQYTRNSVFEDCEFDTKDAFWHAENVLVRDSVIRGEYLAWYSDGLTLERCRISGTQPLCYCKNLRLIDCELTEADLCFEKSEVDASITTPVISVKNPRAGLIRLPAVGDFILDDPEAKGALLLPSP